MAERTIASESLYRLRPLTWEKSDLDNSVCRVLGTGIEVRKIRGQWHYTGPTWKGFKPANSRPEAKRLAVAALLEWIEEAFSKVS